MDVFHITSSLQFCQYKSFHYIVSPQVCCAESELEEIQEWFNSRFKPWNATVITVDHPLPESGSSAMGRFLFSASPLMQELQGEWQEYCQVLKM